MACGSGAFKRDRNVLGRSVTRNGEAIPSSASCRASFRFAPFWATHAELWVPVAFGEGIHNRGGNSLRVFARLKQGVTLEQARAEMATITARLELAVSGHEPRRSSDSAEGERGR